MRCDPQAGLGDGVGEVFRIEAQNFLVEYVDDVAAGAVGKLLGEGLREEDRRPQIDLEVSLPTLSVEAFDRIPIEAGRVVDEASYRS